MDRITFDIFESDGKKFHWTPNMIFLIFYLTPVCLHAIFQTYISSINWLYNSLIFYEIFGVIAAFGYFVAANFLREPLNGKITGKIEFGNDFIKVDDVRFELKDITGLDFSLLDYYGRMPQLGGTLNHRLSQGVKNYVTFRYKSSQIYNIRFRLMGKHSYQSLAGFINEAVKFGKLDIYEATNLIGKENIAQ